MKRTMRQWYRHLTNVKKMTGYRYADICWRIFKILLRSTLFHRAYAQVILVAVKPILMAFLHRLQCFFLIKDWSGSTKYKSANVQRDGLITCDVTLCLYIRLYVECIVSIKQRSKRKKLPSGNWPSWVKVPTLLTFWAITLNKLRIFYASRRPLRPPQLIQV